MTVAVFGASGFIGSHLVNRLKELGRSHLAFAHRTPAAGQVPIDFENPASYSQLLRGMNSVVLLISQSRPGTLLGRAELEVTHNVLPYARFIEVAASANIRRVIFVSSGGTVYGRQSDRTAIGEDHPTLPINPYGTGKLMIETLLKSFLGVAGIALTILRPANPVGPGQRVGCQGFVSSAAHAAKTRTPIEIWGDGSIVRDYFHVGDLANAIVLALGEAAADRLYNVSSGVGSSINEVLEIVESVAGMPIERRYAPGRHVDVPINVLSYKAIKQELGWQPSMNLREIVQASWVT